MRSYSLQDKIIVKIMDPAKASCMNDRKGFIANVQNENLTFEQSDFSADDSCEYESSVEDDYYLEDDFTSLKDVSRSKKFYLKKKRLNEAKARLNELEDVFMERTAENYNDSEEEKIIQVVWSEDDPIQSKLVRFVEALDIKKSNSKFTLSMLSEDQGVEIDSSEGEEIKGRFLEVKDSLEVIATSSRSLHSSKYSDWDFTTENDQEVNRIWRKRESPWTSSLQIEIGKLPSEADQATVLQVLDSGAKGKISVRDVTECLGNLLDKANNDCDNPPSKKVSFSTIPSSKSVSSKENLSRGNSPLPKAASQKKVKFPEEYNCRETVDETAEKPVKKVSFYELVNDEFENTVPAETLKIKKAVSFHDSVEFNRTDRNKDCSNLNGYFSEESDDNHSSFTSKTSSDKSQDTSALYNDDAKSDSSGWCANTTSEFTSGYSLVDSFSTFSNRTISSDSMVLSECHEFSQNSRNSLNRKIAKALDTSLDFTRTPTNLLAQLKPIEDDGVAPSDFSRGSDSETVTLDEFLVDIKNTHRPESREERFEFIGQLLENYLNRQLDENCENTFRKNTVEQEKETPLMNRFGKTIKHFYNQCRDMIDTESLSKSMGLVMAFQGGSSDQVELKIKEERVDSSSNTARSFDATFEEYQRSNIPTNSTKVKSFETKTNYLSLNSSKSPITEDDYQTADSENEIQASNFAV